MPEQKWEELLFLIPKVDTLFVPEELHEFLGCHESSRSIPVLASTAQPRCLHESMVMVARERDQGGVALHSATLARAACSGLPTGVRTGRGYGDAMRLAITLSMMP
jgi:hypothetical protein